MSERSNLVIAILLGLVIGLVCLYFNRPKIIKTETTYQTQIDSIEVVNDNIKLQIDTVYKNIEKTKIQYEKDVHRIINNTADEDLCFFRDYIKLNKARLDSNIYR